MEMHWLPVRERIVFKLTVLTREARRTRQPTYLAELLVDRVVPRILRSASDTTQLVVPRTRNRRWTCAFSSAAPVVWNSLLKCARDCNSLPVFKSQLKTFLFNYLTETETIPLGRAYESDYLSGNDGALQVTYTTTTTTTTIIIVRCRLRRLLCHVARCMKFRKK